MGHLFKKSDFGSFQSQTQTAESVWGHSTFHNQGTSNTGFGSRSSSSQQGRQQNTGFNQQSHQNFGNNSINGRIHNNGQQSGRRNSKSGPFSHQTFDNAWNDAVGF